MIPPILSNSLVLSLNHRCITFCLLRTKKALHLENISWHMLRNTAHIRQLHALNASLYTFIPPVRVPSRQELTDKTKQQTYRLTMPNRPDLFCGRKPASLRCAPTTILIPTTTPDLVEITNNGLSPFTKVQKPTSETQKEVLDSKKRRELLIKRMRELFLQVKLDEMQAGNWMGGFRKAPWKHTRPERVPWRKRRDNSAVIKGKIKTSSRMMKGG